jgi:alginate O-acetyltransferase complex protein AlgJ
MTTLHTPNREEQALAEVGHTSISRNTALGFLVVFLVTIGGVPVLQAVLDWRGTNPNAGTIARISPPAGRFLDLATGAWPTEERWGAAALAELNRGLLSALTEAEDVLEETSLLRERALPRLQWAQTAMLGIGNEQAYIGRDGWLFFRADVDYVLGPGFLEPGVLARRARGGDVAEDPPVPDPRPALAAFDDQLAERGIRLIVMPTPVKPTIHPEAFSARVDSTIAPIQNPSFDQLVADLTALGIDVFDPAPIMAAAARGGQAQFLETDTHWTPGAVELIAGNLADVVRKELPVPAERYGYSSREIVVDGSGDIAAMLRLPRGSELFPGERVRLRTILEPGGRSWRPPTTAEVLVLGDSFTNVFSDPDLGWGAGGGLAEQLSFELDRPVARLALNAGGAAASRLALGRDARGGRDRLARVKVVVYQFATRELAQGNWPVLEELATSSR